MRNSAIDRTKIQCKNVTLSSNFPPPRRMGSFARRYGFLVIALLSISVFGHSAFAADAPLTIDQQSTSGVVGEWALTMPSGTTMQSSDPGVNRTSHPIPTAAPGTYRISVTPPSGAHVVITVKQNTTTVSSVSGLSSTFTLRAGEPLRVTIAYSYEGTIRVLSNPTGVKVHVVAPGITLTGMTPVTFSDLPPFHYTVYYGAVAGCITPRPQKRSLSEGTPLVFSATYRCDGAPPPPPPPPPPAPQPDSGEHPLSEIGFRHEVSQSEVLPGGTFKITIRVKNPTDHRIRDLIVTEILPQDVSVDVLPQGGTRRGNTLRWSVPDLDPNESWTIVLTAAVARNVRGDSLDLTANAEGDGLPDPTGKIVRVMVLRDLPETGGAFDLLFLAFSAIAAFGFMKSTQKLRA